MAICDQGMGNCSSKLTSMWPNVLDGTQSWHYLTYCVIFLINMRATDFLCCNFNQLGWNFLIRNCMDVIYMLFSGPSCLPQMAMAMMNKVELVKKSLCNCSCWVWARVVSWPWVVMAKTSSQTSVGSRSKVFCYLPDSVEDPCAESLL